MCVKTILENVKNAMQDAEEMGGVAGIAKFEFHTMEKQ